MTELMIDRDPRLREFAEAYADSRLGLQAPSGAGERYRNALMPYATYWAEETPQHARGAMMEALFNGGIPLGIVLAAFRASEEEGEAIRRASPPLVQAPVNEADRLRSLSYHAYLKTDHWRRVREGALQRAEGRCMLCNASDGLEVHHRTYERRGRERPADVAVLCSNCHGRHHGKLRAVA